MSNWQNKVRAGDPVRHSAAAYNAFIDAAVAHRNLATSGTTRGASRTGDYVMAENRGTKIAESWYPVILDAGVEESVARRDTRVVLAFGDANSDATPHSAFGCVAVPQEPIRPGATGLACVAGMTYAVCAVAANYAIRPGQRLGYATISGLDSVTPCFGRNSYGNAIAYGVAKSIDAETELRPVRLTAGSHAFSARITSSTQIDDVPQWEYGWEEVRAEFYSGGYDLVVPPGGMGSAADGKAYNILEAANTTTTAYGGPVTGDDFAINETGVLFRPVPTGAVVQMWFEVDGGMTAIGRPMFQAPNAVYGPCTPLNGVT